MTNRNLLRAALGCAALWLAHLPAMAALPIQHWTQPSGANIYFVESPSIPIVDVQIDFDAGARRDPADKAGLARATADMSSKGIVAATPPAGGAYDAAMDENQVSEARLGPTSARDSAKAPPPTG
jgi:zinc protease